MPFFTPRYDPGAVAASVLIATFASFVALDLAKRVRAQDRALALAWWAGGSLAMGTGIWSMHFVGMAAYSLPIAVGYTQGYTFVSWLAGVGVSAIALGIAGQGRLTAARVAGGALAMGAGICTMHYIGMAALEMAPGIVWSWPLVAASAAIAVAASAVALVIFLRLPSAGPRLHQAVAAVVMGLAISGMHYTGMAAANVPAGAMCLSAGGLNATGVGALVIAASMVLLGLTLLTSVLDARAQDKTTRLAQRLQTANEQLQAANEQLQRQAFLDALTGLPNRMLFEDRLMHAVARIERAEDRIVGHERGQERLAVLFIDLDGFKPVNDSLGHLAGDEVLKQAARRMLATARDIDTVARIGGDEFVLLMEHVAGVADAVALALRAVQALSEPYDASGRQIGISASVGIVVYPDQGERGKLLAQADAAMYAAKRAGGGTYALFEPHMGADALDQLHLQGDLRRAVQRGELLLHYQPKVDGRRGQINGVEALLRWNHAQRGMIAPGVFIPLAERFGLISEIGNWVIDEVCRQIAAWRDDGVRMRVAINLSVHQLRQDDLVDRIRQALDRHAVDASQLLCEITESVAMEDIRTTQRAFEGLAGSGVFLSIDDFGTGYSSLSYLRQLPARQIKIDRSFVKDLAATADARAVVDAVIKLAHALGLRVVAEGVETEAQRDILLRLGCDELQGFYFARPMPAAMLLSWTRGPKPADRPDFTPSVIEARL
jgi:diguanylate cyclase (GGDEF)-like protein